MTEEHAQTPDQQANPGQQAPAASTPPVENWKERYDGLNKKVQELVLQARSLEEQLGSKSSELEQLRSQLSIKDTEKTVAVGERDKQIENLLQQNQTAEGELRRLKALEMKIKVAQELKRPELVELAKHIPDLEDAEALKVVMQDLARFADDAVKAREEQLLAGVTLNAGGSQVKEAGPATEQEWVRAIEKATLGSRERRELMDAYGDWLEKTNSRR